MDTDVLIEAKNRYYGFGRVPRFWEWCREAHEMGELFSVEKILEEISRGQDELKDWASELPSSFFISPDYATVEAITQLSEWVTDHPRYSQTAKAKFRSSGDIYLIAEGLAHNYTIVTLETSAPDSVHSVKIPDVCINHGVDCELIWGWLDHCNPQF